MGIKECRRCELAMFPKGARRPAGVPSDKLSPYRVTGDVTLSFTHSTYLGVKSLEQLLQAQMNWTQRPYHRTSRDAGALP